MIGGEGRRLGIVRSVRIARGLERIQELKANCMVFIVCHDGFSS